MTRIAIDNHWQCHGSSLLALFCDKGNAVKRDKRGTTQDSVMACTIDRGGARFYQRSVLSTRNREIAMRWRKEMTHSTVYNSS
ncbi:hypothetical protein DA718_15135 [Klebsiella huaxiensis]|nr:hypothetical protein DA718_15135 [Klebsiella huaxiensis]